MCLLIVSQNGTMPYNHVMETGIISNPHGWGYACYRDKEIFIRRGFGKKEFNKYKDEIIGYPFIMHFRFATHGDISTNNCHPFTMKNVGVLAHNGVIRTIFICDESKSDTWHLARIVEKKVNKDKDFLNKDKNVEKLENLIGFNNKVIIMTLKGKFIFLNEEAGYWNDGIWYSENINNKFLYEDFAFGGVEDYDGNKNCKYYSVCGSEDTCKFCDFNSDDWDNYYNDWQKYSNHVEENNEEYSYI